jgi:hypothetical protein
MRAFNYLQISNKVPANSIHMIVRIVTLNVSS